LSKLKPYIGMASYTSTLSPYQPIAAAFEVTPPTISQHLTVLRDAGLVEMRVDGNFRRYRARQHAFRGLEALLAHTGRWRPQPGDEPGAAADGPGGAPVECRVDRAAVLSVEVHQHAATEAEADALGAFWRSVLARLRANIEVALDD